MQKNEDLLKRQTEIADSLLEGLDTDSIDKTVEDFNKDLDKTKKLYVLKEKTMLTQELKERRTY